MFEGTEVCSIPYYLINYFCKKMTKWSANIDLCEWIDAHCNYAWNGHICHWTVQLSNSSDPSIYSVLVLHLSRSTVYSLHVLLAGVAVAGVTRGGGARMCTSVPVGSYSSSLAYPSEPMHGICPAWELSVGHRSWEGCVAAVPPLRRLKQHQCLMPPYHPKALQWSYMPERASISTWQNKLNDSMGTTKCFWNK